MGFENIDFALYLNISFFSVLAIGLIFGLLKGFRRSLYTFIITILFIGIFFITVNPIVAYLYNLELNFIGGLLANVSSGLSQTTSIQEAARLFLFDMLGDNLDKSLTNPEFLAFVDAIGIFVLKIVYTILYFTIIQFIYRFILFIVSVFIFRKGRSKNKKGKRGRVLGGTFGTLTAAVNVFVMIIVLSGLISISESLVSLQGDTLAYEVDLDNNVKPNIANIDQSLTKIGNLNPQQMAETNSELDDAMASLNTIITEYNNNIIIQGLNTFQVEDEVTGENKNLAIVLFDEVLSINYENESIALRQDLRTFTEIAGIFLNSDFYGTKNLADLKSQEVNDMFLTLSKSKLITTIIPIGIEVGMDYMDVDYELDKQLLYEDINWQEELAQLGVVASTGFMILENANVFDEGVNYKTVSINGDEVEGFFTELSNSKLVEYGAYIAIEPLLQGASQNLQSVITVPEDINWKAEFQAFGMIANEILSTGLTIADLEGENQQELLLLFTDVDLTVLLNSTLTSNALINIFSGQSSIDFSIDFLVIPDVDNIQWTDTIDELSGEVIQAGELRNILISLNILVQQLDNIDMDNLNIQDLSSISDEDIDQMFESVILVASISKLITDLDTGDFSLVIPDRVLDINNYIIKEEVTNIFKALTMAAREIPCDEGNIACEGIGFDMDKVTQLTSENVDTLFSSDILYATTASMLNDFEELVVPEDIKEDVLVGGLILSIPTKQEIKNTFSAITALGITNFDGLSISGDLLLNLAVDPVTDPTTLDTTKTDKLFASAILHATISYFILQETDVTPPETSPIVVPYFAAEDYENTTSNVVRYYHTEGEVDYISDNELTNLLQAILVLNISDFSTFDTIEISTIISNSQLILDSAILHATFSEQIMNLDGSGLIVPNKDELNNDLIITTGVLLEEQTTYIIKTELISTLDALEVLDITDFNNPTIDVTVLKKLSKDIAPTELDENKTALLFSSKILHATITDFIIQEADGTATASLILPYYASENYEFTTSNVVRISNNLDEEYITINELNALIAAFLVLDINDFTEVDGLDFVKITANSTIILKSAILHATISDQMLDLNTSESLVIPNLDELNQPLRITTGSVVEEQNIYIIKDEIIATLDALDILGITDFNNVTIDASVLTNLAIDGDPTLLDTTKSATLLSSKIAHATLTKVILDAGKPDDITGESDIVVPFVATENYATGNGNVRFVTNDDDVYIIEEELTNLFRAVLILNITDFNQVDGLQLSTIATHKDIVLDSAILHATISDQVIELGKSDALVLPEQDLNNQAIKITKGDILAEETEYILKDELKNTLDALDVLEITDFNNVTINASILQKLAQDGNPTLLDPVKSSTLLSSKIAHATISKVILDAGEPDTITGESDLIVPYYATENYAGSLSNVVRFTTTALDHYITELELTELFEAILVLDITDFTQVDGLLLSDLIENSTTLLESAVLHATISKQVQDLNTSSSNIIIPEFNELGNSIVLVDTLGDNAEFIIKSELEATFTAMDLLNILDIASFDGSIDLTLFFESVHPLDYNDNQNTLLASSIMQATISDKLANLETLGTLIIPSVDVLNQNVEVTYVTDYYVYKTEIKALINAMDIFGVTNIETFDGTISIANFSTETNQNILLTSAIMHMTVSDQILGNASTVVPEKSLESDLSSVNIRIIQDGNEFILGDEIKALINVMNLISSGNISDFTGDITLSLFDGDTNPTNQTTLLSSAIMHATVSKQVFDLDALNTLVAPEEDIDSLIIRRTVIGTLINTEYLIKSEIAALIDGLNAMGLGNQSITSFTGTIGISALSTEIVQNKVLDSATLHATISKQVIDLDTANTLVAPNKTLDALDNEIFIRITTGSTFTTEFLIKNEVKALIDGLNILGLGGQNISDFDGNLTISNLDTNQKQDDVLASAVLHATFSDKLIGMDDQILFVPNYTEAGELAANRIKYIVTTTDFIIKDEIKAIINAFSIMGYLSINDVNSSFTLDTFFDNPDIVLASSSIQATVSKKLLNDTGGSLIIPDNDINENPDKVIRIVQTDVTYIELVELKALLAGLESLGLTNFTGMTFTTTNIFAANFTIVLTSASLQATISDTVLAGAVDENNITSSSDLIVPTFFRETISVNSIAATHIEKTELHNLLTGLKVLNITSFTGGVNPAVVTSLSSANLNIILNSGSLHVTIDNMLQANATLIIPTFVLVDLYNIVGLIEKTEIVNFIAAVNALGETDITNASINFTTITSLTPAEQDTVLDSAIVRATVTPDVETAKANAELIDPYTGTWEYEVDGTTLTKASIQGVINQYY